MKKEIKIDFKNDLEKRLIPFELSEDKIIIDVDELKEYFRLTAQEAKKTLTSYELENIISKYKDVKQDRSKNRKNSKDEFDSKNEDK